MATKKISPAAFLSYVHSDDEHEDGRITQLRGRLSEEVKFQTAEEFPIFQDRNNIKWGENWEKRIDGALGAVTFLIPILTPSFFKAIIAAKRLRSFWIARSSLIGTISSSRFITSTRPCSMIRTSVLKTHWLSRSWSISTPIGGNCDMNR